jgi:hypothetical protein
MQTSPGGHVALGELEQPEAMSIASMVAVTRPKNIERISFLLDPRLRSPRLPCDRVVRPYGLYPDAGESISQVTLRPTKSGVNRRLRAK